jgi:hypothetical protein
MRFAVELVRYTGANADSAICEHAAEVTSNIFPNILLLLLYGNFLRLF